MRIRLLGTAACSLLLLLGACGGDDDDASSSDDDTTTTTESSDDDDSSDDDSSDDDSSDDDSSGDEDEFVDAFAEGVGEDDEFDISDEDAECIGRAVIDVIGVDTLADADVDPDDLVAADSLDELGIELDDEQVDELADAFLDCDIDFGDALTEELTSELGGAALSEDSLSCIEDEITGSDFLADAFVEAVVSGDQGSSESAGQEVAFAAFAACPGALTELFVIGLEQGGLTIDDAARECIAEQVEADPEPLVESFTSGDQAVAQAILAECDLVP